MKTSYLFGAAVAASALVGVMDNADAATAAAFTFETTGLSNASTTGATFGPLLADVGVGSMSVNHFDPTGAGSLATYSFVNGNGSPKGFKATHWGVADSYVFGVSTVGVTGISVSFDMAADALGPKSFGIAVSKDNGLNYTTISGASNNSAAFTMSSTGFNAGSSNSAFTFSFNFSGVTSLNNNPSVAFRLQNLDFNNPAQRSDGGANFLDNFVVTGTAVPEPATMGVALVAVGGLLGRRARR